MNFKQINKLMKYHEAFDQVTEILQNQVKKDNSQELNDLLEYFASKDWSDAKDDIVEWGQITELKKDLK